ncbi:hypothetical protein Tco_0669120 [Tanacetum coccineum]
MSIEEMVFPPIQNRAPSVDPILISVLVYERKVGRVLLDEGATCDIIYEHCFLKLRKEVRERKKDVYTTLFGFSGEQVNPLGDISHKLNEDKKSHTRTTKVKRNGTRVECRCLKGSGRIKKSRNPLRNKIPNVGIKYRHGQKDRRRLENIFIQKCGKIPAILQNAKGVPREERLPVDTRGRQSFERQKRGEIFFFTVEQHVPHTRTPKGWRERDHIPSSLKGVRKRSPNGEKRKRQKAYILCKHSVTRRWAKLPNHRKVGARLGPRSKKTREAIELEEHKIKYKPRNAIKAQVLVDFLAETQEEDDEIDFQNQEEKGKNLGVEAIY